MRSALRFIETRLTGAFQIELEPHRDERGFFARTFCAEEFAAHRIQVTVAQCNVAFNELQGTLRGLHYQIAPTAESKLIRCTRGAIYDVIIDLRSESPTYLQHVSVELNEDNHRALYVPERFAHGYQVLADKTETSYQVGEFYSPPNERALRWDDPLLAPDIQMLIRRSGAAAPLLDAVRNRLKRGQPPTLAGEAAPIAASPAAPQELPR